MTHFALHSRPFSMRRFRAGERRAGFSLAELIVAIGLLASLALTVGSAMAYASRTARLNGHAITAKNIAQSFLERMLVDDYENIGPAGYPDIDFGADPSVWLDHAPAIPCKIEFEFKGFGRLLENSSVNNLTDANALWERDEWAGDLVYLLEGPGAGQFVKVRGNTANTLHLDSRLKVKPGKGTKYMISHGKTVKVTATWKYLGQEHSQSVESLIVDFRNGGRIDF